MSKAFEMNSFAVENGYAAGSRGCPRGFAAVEQSFDESEAAILCWTAQKVREKNVKGMLFEGTTAFALTLGRLVFSGRISGNYEVRSIPVWSITDVRVSKKSLFFKKEIVVTHSAGELRFLCGSAPRKLCLEILDSLNSQM